MLDLERRAFDPANTGRVIVNSEMVRREILANFPFPNDRIHLVRNGIEVERFAKGNREATRKRFGFGPNDRVLLFVGSGWERKGLATLLQAFEMLELPDWVRRSEVVQPPAWSTAGTPVRLLVVGKGRIPAKTSRNVLFTGPMADVENAYAAADLFVFPPIYEPSANVVIEALAAGLPVITTAQNGASEWIEEGWNGTVIDSPVDVAGLAQAISEWLDKPGERTTPDRAAMSLERNVRETLAVLELASRERKPIR
jgi:UDP-glucose:(heptosyl)LPS alpha-1,3-glucosyltransferase